RLHRGARRLRLANGAHDARERRVATDAPRHHAERPRAVQRAAGDLVTTALLHRETLTREHGLVHGRRAVDHHAVHGDPLARPDHAHVTHGHVGDVVGMQNGQYSEENVLRQLALNARYGVTTVNSLGGDQEPGLRVRNAQNVPTLNRSRLYLAGTVVTGDTPDEALAMVDENAAMGVDFIKIRVDDNLGTSTKMTPAVYQAVIDRAHEHGLRVASHLYYLDDAKSLLNAGTNFVAHSVRDQAVDEALIDLLVEKDVCYSPTLTREVSTFVYEDEPSFFADPFFLAEADPAVLEQLRDPERQEGVRNSRSAQAYKGALEVAMRNLRPLVDGGATIAFGTDAGPRARFQGYFEHMELTLMAEAGLTPMEILVSATGNAAACLGLEDVGTLEAGKWADFVVLTDNPLDDINNSRTIESVWIAGNRVPGR
ncbi:MAG: amidohydrolase family protein, partial [Gemmatimonadetes bacterium]|nr:amidohydrolase family protein [Gemmatimonadota bacterium]